MTIGQFDLDPTWEAPVIYRDYAHLTTQYGGIVFPEEVLELKRFVKEYASFLGLSTPYFRMDVYPDARRRLNLLEVNTAFVDGWGTALNLSRMAGISTERPVFPLNFSCVEEEYRPELDLLIAELQEKDSFHTVAQWTGEATYPTYVYGRTSVVSPMIYPYDGVRLDNKLNLAEFSKGWRGNVLSIPQFYETQTSSWEDIPEDVFLKFVNKWGEESTQARFSVLAKKPQGKSAFLKRCYAERSLIAQKAVVPYRYAIERDRKECSVQLVILTDGDMLVGYTQFAAREIITDNSIHGPLQFCAC